MKKKTCLRCGKSWMAYLASPVQCSRCHSPYWNKPRRGGEGAPEVAIDVQPGNAGDIAKVIGAFRAINPAASFSDPRNRRSAAELVAAHGVERVLSATSAAGKANGQEYAPVIASLRDLLEKWPKLEAFYRRKSKPTHVKIS